MPLIQLGIHLPLYDYQKTAASGGVDEAGLIAFQDLGTLNQRIRAQEELSSLFPLQPCSD